MNVFLDGHATHPDWRMALSLAAAQVDAQRADGAGRVREPTLGWLYLTDAFAADAEALLAAVQARWPGVAWVGGVGIGVAANGVEYFEEPALALLLGDLPREQWQLFSGERPLGAFDAATAQVHADPSTPDLADLVGEMAGRTSTGYLFGGLVASRTRGLHIAGAVLQGGLSGVAFAPSVALLSRVTQGCQPIGRVRRITAADRNRVLTLDGEPALGALLDDLKIDELQLRQALPKLRQTLVGLSDAGADALSRPGQFGTDTLVRHLVGLDPAAGAIAIADNAEVGMQLAFCSRHTEAARRDLVRICAEIRDELEPETQTLETALALQGAEADRRPHPARRIAGAIYVSCAGRGGPHFGAPSAELAIVRRALGDVPLAGFFAAGEIARHHLYGYTGVLTVFPAEPDDA